MERRWQNATVRAGQPEHRDECRRSGDGKYDEKYEDSSEDTHHSCRLTPQFSGRALRCPAPTYHGPLQLLVCSASGTHRDKLGPMGYS
jgi:hypothetical protein